MLSYVRFLIATDRWTEIAKHFGEIGDNGNSHRRYLDFYKSMLAVFEPILATRVAKNRTSLDAYKLNADALKAIADARGSASGADPAE